MRRFTDRAGMDWRAFECDDGTEVAMDLPLGALEGLTDEELILLLTKGLK